MHLDLPVFNTVEEAMKAVQVKTLEFTKLTVLCAKILEAIV